jgi:hypothetical protein
MLSDFSQDSGHVLLGSVFSKQTFLESSPGVNDGAMVGPEGVNWAGGSLFSLGGEDWKLRHDGACVRAPES